MTSVTVFGLMDHYLLYDNDPTTARLFDGELRPKPAFYAVARPEQAWKLTKEEYEKEPED